MDALAQRYGVLPSMLLDQGDTFDLLCMDVATTYQLHKQNNTKDPGQFYNPEELQAKMDKVRNG